MMKGIFSSLIQVLTPGQTATVQLSKMGSMACSNAGKPLNFSASANALVTGPTYLQGLVVNSQTTGTIKIYDSLTQTGTVMFNTISFAATDRFIPFFGAKSEIGISVTITGTADLTLVVA